MDRSRWSHGGLIRLPTGGARGRLREARAGARRAITAGEAAGQRPLEEKRCRHQGEDQSDQELVASSHHALPAPSAIGGERNCEQLPLARPKASSAKRCTNDLEGTATSTL